MTKEQDLLEFETRAKNGALAGVGTFAITALSCYRISQEMYYEPDLPKVLTVSGIAAGIAALTWFCMPAATGDVEETIEEVKQQVTGPAKVALNRVLASQLEATKKVQQAVQTLNQKTSTSGWQYVGSTSSAETRNASYMRGFNAKPVSVFDNSTNDDYDPLEDEDLEEFYRSLEDEDDYVARPRS